MFKSMDRLAANRAIIEILTTEVERHPDWRFHQLLQNLNVERPNEDPFYEESDTTLKLLELQDLAKTS